MSKFDLSYQNQEINQNVVKKNFLPFELIEK